MAYSRGLSSTSVDGFDSRVGFCPRLVFTWVLSSMKNNHGNYLDESGNYPDLSKIPFEVSCPRGIVHGYFECLCSMMKGRVDDDGNEEDYSGLSDSLILSSVALCERFYYDNKAVVDLCIEELIESRQKIWGGLANEDCEWIGSLLYYATHGHGRGFYEEEFSQEEVLHDWCKQNSDWDEYVGDDGLLYVCGDEDTDCEALKQEYPEVFDND